MSYEYCNRYEPNLLYVRGDPTNVRGGKRGEEEIKEPTRRGSVGTPKGDKPPKKPRRDDPELKRLESIINN